MRFQLRDKISESISIGFTGDFAPGFPDYIPISKSPLLLKLLRHCDLVVANLESPLTSSPSVKKRGVSICSDPKSIQEFSELGVNAVNLANNHIMDHGYQGLHDTLKYLSQKGISYFGAGNDIKHSSRPLVYETNKKSIGFLAYSYQPTDIDALAAESSPGANPLIIEEAKKQIEKMRKKGHLVCASYHGGNEFFRIPCPKFRATLKELAQAGAHIVIGHHAHLFQGVEIVHDSLIAYGLGNFFMIPPYKVKNKGTNIGLFLIAEIDREGPWAYSVHFLHNQRVSRHLSIAQKREEKALLDLFMYISEILTDETQYRREWRRDCCRFALGLNGVGEKGRWLRAARSTAAAAKKTTKSLLTMWNDHSNTLGRQPASTIAEIYAAAVRGMPLCSNDFKTLTRPYRAYDMLADS